VFILLRVVVNVVINVVIVFIAVVITIIAFFVIKAVIKAFRLIFFTTRIIFTEQLLRSAWERHHYYRSRRTLREKNKRGKGVSRLFNNI
jgi:hypothetical protein